MKDKFKETLTNILSYLLKVERRTLLWENPNISTAFAPQTISLDLRKYDAVEISFKHYFSGDTPQSMARAEKNVTCCCAVPTYSNRSLPRRDFKATDTGVTFGYGSGFDDTYTWYAQNNNWAIPVKIYGIKYGGGYYVAQLFQGFAPFSRLGVA